MTKKIFVAAAVLSSSLFAATFTGTSFAQSSPKDVAETLETQSIQFDKAQDNDQQKPGPKTPTEVHVPPANPSLYVSVSPSIGATGVNPTAPVVFTLNAPLVPKFKGDFRHLPGLVAEVYDGTTFTTLPASDISVDESSGTVTISHPTFNRHTEYAVILEVGPEHPLKTPDYTDVVTGVDTASGQVTLLGHGQLTLVDPHGRLDPSIKTLKVGQVVDVDVDRKGSKVTIDNPHEQALTALFTTGSAIGEATQVSASINSPVSVDNGGILKVTATDDYGNPATNASVTVTGSGSFVSASATIKNGTAPVPLNDQVAEDVKLTYTVKDNTYSDQADDTNTGTASETFVPGAPKTLTFQPSQTTVQSGRPATLTGTVYDQYNNVATNDTDSIDVSVNSGTPVAEALSNGMFTYSLDTSDDQTVGTYAVSAADGSVTGSASIEVTPGPADATQSQVNFPTGSVVAGKAYTVTGTVEDQYGNVIPKQAVNLNFDGQTGTASTEQDGSFSVSVTPQAVVTGGTATVSFGGGRVTGSGSVIAGAAALVQLKSSEPSISAGADDTITGVVTDGYGNPANVPDGTIVKLDSTSGVVPSSVKTSGGQFTFDLFQDTTTSTDVVTAKLGSLPTAQLSFTVAGEVSSSTTNEMAPGYVMNTIISSGAAWQSEYDLGPMGMGPWGQISGWTDPAARWMWSTPGAAGLADVGYTYNRHDFMLNKLTALSITATADNEVTVYVDGQEVTRGSAWESAYTGTTQTLSPGLHTILVVAHNDGGPAGFIVSAKDTSGNVVFDQSSHWYDTPSVPTTIQVSPFVPNVTAGTPDTITGTVKDQNGNPVPDGTVLSVTTSGGSIIPSVTTTGGQFTVTLSNDTQSGTDNIQVIAANGVIGTTSVLVTPGTVDAAESTISALATVNVGTDAITVSVVPKDAYGNALGGGQTVLVSDGTVSQPAIWNTASNDYEAVFTNEQSHSVTFTATVGSSALTNTATSDIAWISPLISNVTYSGLYGNGPITNGLFTGWNSGAGDGWIQFQYQVPQTISQIQITGNAVPDYSTEPYTIYGEQDGNWVQIGQTTQNVHKSTPFVVSVTPGTYSGLKVSVGQSTSWIAITSILLG